MTDGKRRGLRAVLRNAVMWGGAWAVAGGGIVTVLRLLSSDPGIESLVERVGLAVMTGAAWGVRFGLAGAVIGTVFAVALRVGFRGRRLADISPLRFTLLGAVVGGAGVPLFLQLMNVLSGDGPIAWGLVLDDARWATVFGAAVAGGSILLARRAERLSAGSTPGAVEAGDALAALPPAESSPSSLAQRTQRAR